jgi:DNA-binding NarL/FixJ family response regulator
VTVVAERSGAPARQAVPRRSSVLVVVPDPVLRAAVVRQLVGLGASDILEAASVNEARARARGGGIGGLCVVDTRLPDGSGLGLVSELRTAGWPRALVLSSAEDPYTVRAALAAGVRSYLVASGLVSPDGPGVRPLELVAAPVGGVVRPRTPSGPAGLSGREVEVLQLVADGQSNRHIGDALGLSALTVKSHLARISRKLGTGDRAEMVLVALRAGVIA